MPRRGSGRCVEWTGKTGGQGGYPMAYSSKTKKSEYVHRAMHEAFIGPIPEGQVVRHSCDNPRCINPSHLEAGTQQQNMQDCLDRGRREVKRTSEVVAEIRARVEAGESFNAIGKAMGLADVTVARACPEVKRGRPGSPEWIAAKMKKAMEERSG